jgi:hypothetical protein
MGDIPLRTKLAFYSWLTLLLITMATFAAGLSGHIVALAAGPWISLRTQAVIHATIPVILTAVKFVTVPLLLLLTPFARHHPTFKSWQRWSKVQLLRLEAAAKVPAALVKALFVRVKSLFCRPR